MGGHLLYSPTTGHLLYNPASGHLIYGLGSIEVTFTGYIKANNFGTPVYFYGGTFQCDWVPGSGIYYYLSFPNSITVWQNAGTWYCRIQKSWGSYYNAASEWSNGSRVGSYSFYQSVSIGTDEEDAVTAVSVADL